MMTLDAEFHGMQSDMKESGLGVPLYYRIRPRVFTLNEKKGRGGGGKQILASARSTGR
jgi:hypothetical protein